MFKKFVVSLFIISSLSTSAMAHGHHHHHGSESQNAYTKTRYPIVLMHGMLGFDRLFNVLSYWFGIVKGMEEGGAEVYVLKLSNLNDDAVRGEEALAQVESIVAMTGAAKVNIIGHSQGGHAARYVAAVRPDLVASITTVATPNYGADFADYMVTHPGPGKLRDFIVNSVTALGKFVGVVSGDRTEGNALGMLYALSSTGSAAFNASYPGGLPQTYCGEGPRRGEGGMYYFSWGGVGIHTNPFDPTDAEMSATAATYRDANDGLVARCSNHFGHSLRDDYFQNHYDGVNQLLGMVSHTGANPVSVFRAHANRLKKLGL